MRVNVNTDELAKLNLKLEKVHRSEFPVTVRNTLNTMAFETKKKTLPEEFDKSFTIRSKSFSKAFSSVKTAQGFNVKTMKSTVGMTDRKRGGRPEQAGRDMTPQQLGGKIGGRTFIPMKQARTSKNPNKNVRKENRLSNITKIVNTKDNSSGTEKQKFVRTALNVATHHGKKTLVRHKGVLYRIDRAGSNIKTRKMDLKVTPIYSVEEGRSVKVSSSPVTRRAALRTHKRANVIFVKQAEKKIKTIMK